MISILLPAYGQGDLHIGQWSELLPYNIGSSVTQSPTRVYYGTEFGLISIRKDDSSSVDFFSKVDGLSDVGPSWIRYHNGLKTLVIGYKNGNIDLLDSSGTSNVNDILRSSSIQGDKAIKNIYTDDSQLAYLSTPFGLVILDLVTRQFRSTIFTSSPAHGFAIFQSKYYLSTDNGLYVFDPASGNIIENFNQWEKIIIPGIPAIYSSEAVAVFHDQLYFGAKGDLYRLDHLDSVWYHVDNNTVSFISPEGQNLMVGFRCGDCLGKVLFFNEGVFWHEAGIYCIARPAYAIEDEKGRVWYADMFPDFRMAQNHFATCELLQFESPYSGNVSEMDVHEGILYVATGGVSESYNYLGNKDGFFSYDRLHWTTYNQFNYPEFAAHQLENFFRILHHPTENKLYVGSYYGGLLEYDFENFKFYDTANSSLQGAVGDESRERVSGLAFDQQNNLWVTNYLAPRPLSVLKTDGTWKSFDFPCSTITNVSQVVVDHRGYKWIMLYSKSAGIVVYDDGGTIDDESDDRCIQLGSSNTAIPSNSVNCLAVDLDGDIWVGTAEGPVVFDGGADIFDGHEGSRIKVEQDGVLNYLLGEETVYAIAVDGANRKWFGTGSGVFVQSPAGNEEVASYTTSNSPLLNNRIIDIAIDQNNGVVYIATVGGIMSVRTDAVTGEAIHSDNVYAWPNPVRPDYDGLIAIRGLARDAVVKITDIRGQVLYETKSLGGQAVWDGKDLNGQQASTGVYLVFSTAASDGFNKPDALVTKILVVK
ncbi:MAG TPA: two-component regulator propeller domain-containing protein [Saprospiraceae bacterium]|nr:two-component regulator propeller domain-containing protein [Saprospiraceae bacterium]